MSGCATETQNMRMDETMNLYASTIRWGDFQGAKHFFKSAGLYKDIDFDKLKSVKITAYDVKESLLFNNGNQLRQTVVIRYYNTDVGSEHQVIDHQVWDYNEDKEVWLLVSKMPVFYKM